MTTIKIKKKDNYIIGVECSEHTGFAEYGKDIVCAGISCITQTAILGIKKFTDVQHKYIVEEKSGYLCLELIDIDKKSSSFHDAQIILNTMCCGLEDLQKQYPKYIKLEVK